eukprot:TRINITY_DN88097_c0_g1_i1.p1 TRINITY_DN88097_c0_g1~~TRINITY_DN88097_c0_g1_i1.p1  ORF type:complete len:225 (+),score=23.89 TRINITY_DN88097_c0_g1_i1:147-821(+)
MLKVSMDLQADSINLWLLRGIPRECKELDVINTLRQLEVSQPDFWYMPGIRKPHLHNRGYAFLGYSCTRDVETQRLTEQVSLGYSPWPLHLESSTCPKEHMENNARLWTAPFVTPGMLEREERQPQESWPHQPERCQPEVFSVGQREPSQHASNLSLRALLHTTETTKHVIQKNQSTQRRSGTSNCHANAVESGEYCGHDPRYAHYFVFGDKKFPLATGFPVLF